MSEYIIKETTLSSIGDGVRNITGEVDKLTPEQMTTNLLTAYDELNSQSELIEQLEAALESKASPKPIRDTEIEDALITRTCTEYSNDRVKSIGNYAFYSCTYLTSVNFPVCTNIGSYAFQSCINLTSVNFPACTNIGEYAFRSCTSLNTLTLGASSVCTLYNSSVFYSTGIKSRSGSIYVPASLVASYKAATNWAYFSNIIYAIE